MLGVILIVWSGLTAAFGLYLQSRCARYLERGTASFFALSQITYPNAAVIFDAAIAIKCFGVGVSYMIIIGDLMPGVVLGFLNNANSAPYLVDRNFWITAFMLIIIPLSFLRRLDSLKYTSIVALVSIGYLIVLVIYHFASDKHADPGSIRVIQWGGAIETLSALPVVVFAYTCHQNVCKRTLTGRAQLTCLDVLYLERIEGQLPHKCGWGCRLKHWFCCLYLCRCSYHRLSHLWQCRCWQHRLYV